MGYTGPCGPGKLNDRSTSLPSPRTKDSTKLDSKTFGIAGWTTESLGLTLLRIGSL